MNQLMAAREQLVRYQQKDKLKARSDEDGGRGADMGVDGLDLGDPFNLGDYIPGKEVGMMVLAHMAVTAVGTVRLGGSNAEEEGDGGRLHCERWLSCELSG